MEEESILYEETGRFMIFWPYHFKVYKDRIEARFWPHTHLIPVSDVENVSFVEKIPWYYGWGLRLALGRRMYFAIHHGKSIQIERKSEDCHWKKIILSVKDPEKVMSILERIVQTP